MRLHQESRGHGHLRLVTSEEESPVQIDVSAALNRLEGTLRAPLSDDERRDALALLRSWEWNEMITLTCQERARALVRAHYGRS